MQISNLVSALLIGEKYDVLLLYTVGVALVFEWLVSHVVQIYGGIISIVVSTSSYLTELMIVPRPCEN